MICEAIDVQGEWPPGIFEAKNGHEGFAPASSLAITPQNGAKRNLGQGKSMANKNNMTETQVLAKCIVYGMDGGNTWAKEQAERANKKLVAMLRASEVDDDTFARVSARLGNHSATRQHLEKQGFIKVEADALGVAIREAIAADVKELASLTSGKAR
jgi:hypothetical protein